MVTAATKVVTGWWAVCRAGGYRRGGLRAGAALVARGEFSIVIAGLGVSAGQEPELAPFSAAYVLLLAVVGPFLARWVRRAGTADPARMAAQLKAERTSALRSVISNQTPSGIPTRTRR
jgi:CPA2 family monovalent cation:H+ antiporter-2